MTADEKTTIKQYSFLTITLVNINNAFTEQIWKWFYNALMMQYAIGENLGVMLKTAKEMESDNDE